MVCPRRQLEHKVRGSLTSKQTKVIVIVIIQLVVHYYYKCWPNSRFFGWSQCTFLNFVVIVRDIVRKEQG